MRWLIIGILAVLAAACTTLEIRIESAPTPDYDAISSLANLMIEGTQYAQILSDYEKTPVPVLPDPVYGQISGKVCYPGTTTPPLVIYFRNITNDDLFELKIEEYQNDYSVELLPGKYYIYAWAPQYLVGGIYSKKVLCQDGSACDDHSPVITSLSAGSELDSIDLCDWGLPPESLPMPPGALLQGIDLLSPPRQ
jgi:hypothetical protein